MAPAPAKAKATKAAKAAGGSSRLETDLRAAEAQIKRDLRQLERQMLGLFR